MNNSAYACHNTKVLLRKGKNSCSRVNISILYPYCLTATHAKMSQVVFFNG